MNKAEIMRKANGNEGMTVAEIKGYQKIVKPQTHTYGKYGTLAKIYLEEHNVAKQWALVAEGALPEYLHGVDRQAERMYDSMYAKLSASETYKKTGDFLADLRKETEMQNIIESEILKEIVYVA